jgi:hypothetical protein
MTERINKIRCKHCDDVIESVVTHDFKYCGCGKVAVDGGKAYARRMFPDGNPEDHFEDLKTGFTDDDDIAEDDSDFVLVGGETRSDDVGDDKEDAGEDIRLRLKHPENVDTLNFVPMADKPQWEISFPADSQSMVFNFYDEGKVVEVFRISSDGSLSHMGRPIEGDDEIADGVKSMLGYFKKALSANWGA